MEELTINQRLKFLIKLLSPSVREFSEAIGESFSNTQNYIGKRGIQPKREYLDKVINHFNIVNAQWLLTGEGEAFLPGASPPTIVHQTQKKNRQTQKGGQGNFITTNHGTISYSIEECKKERDSFKNEAELLRLKVESLTSMLALQEALIASKDETIALLRRT